jgi:hypothetical protein
MKAVMTMGISMIKLHDQSHTKTMLKISGVFIKMLAKFIAF